MPRIHGRAALRATRAGNGLPGDGLIGRVRPVIGVGGEVQKKRPALCVRVAHVLGQELQRMIRMSASELGEHVGIRAVGHQLFLVLSRAHHLAAVDMTGAHALVRPIAPRRVFITSIWAGGAVRTRSEPREVKTMIQRRGVQWLCEIGIGPTGGRTAVALAIAQTNMPFANHASALRT